MQIRHVHLAAARLRLGCGRESVHVMNLQRVTRCDADSRRYRSAVEDERIVPVRSMRGCQRELRQSAVRAHAWRLREQDTSAAARKTRQSRGQYDPAIHSQVGALPAHCSDYSACTSGTSTTCSATNQTCSSLVRM